MNTLYSHHNMLSILKLIVLLLIFETIVCRTEQSDLATRIQSIESNIETSKSTVAETIRQTFITVNGPGLVLFNNTYRSAPQGSTSSLEKPIEDSSFLREKDEIDIDPRCKQDGKSFCMEVQNYPALEVENILRDQISKFDVLFGDDDLSQPTNISQRISPGEDSLCKSVERIIYPKAAESRNLKWLYIVNQQNYTQAVKIEECSEPESPCMFAENFPNRYVTKCKQHYTFRQLVAITLDNKVKTDIFKLPSCCKCVIKQL